MRSPPAPYAPQAPPHHTGTPRTTPPLLPLLLLLLLHPLSTAAAPPPLKTALVLSGGGAKGAYEVGVLEALCEHPLLANSWSIITGTSIGAMNAGALAQFAPADQCTDGLAAMNGYWKR